MFLFGLSFTILFILFILSVLGRYSSVSLTRIAGILNSFNRLKIYLADSKFKFFSCNPFPTAPLSIPPCRGIGKIQIYFISIFSCLVFSFSNSFKDFLGVGKSSGIVPPSLFMVFLTSFPTLK